MGNSNNHTGCGDQENFMCADKQEIDFQLENPPKTLGCFCMGSSVDRKNEMNVVGGQPLMR